MQTSDPAVRRIYIIRGTMCCRKVFPLRIILIAGAGILNNSAEGMRRQGQLAQSTDNL
jgi:hypothetical protein